MNISPVAPPTTHETRLDRFAEIAVRVGLGGFQPGQELLMTAPLEALPLARRITAHAYRAGAALVTTLLADDEATLLRYRLAPGDSFGKAAGWLYDGMAAAFRDGAARLAIVGEDPNLLSGEDPSKVARANHARSIAYRPALELITGTAINWTIVAAATPAWAKAVFPDLSGEQAVAQLWDAIFATSRVDAEDPIAAWAAHNATLMARRHRLNAKRYAALHFRGPGTDLRVGLADEHEWMGGLSTARNGITGNPNIPTEEVFTTPHCRHVEGTVASTKPLSHQGTLIRDIAVRFESGRIVRATARSGQDVLQRMLSADDGARRLGEVALVPASSPIARSGLLFFNTLFDENAACHIALGQSYSRCFTDRGKAGAQALAARGANRSLIHVDWMIGSPQVDVDGIAAGGDAEPLLRGGEFV
ncbi:MAG TPA: aminopeptidase [Acetobacteraceae bacterium]|nr:aminopeptidase [Acetobacteraceae bacterium]